MLFGLCIRRVLRLSSGFFLVHLVMGMAIAHSITVDLITNGNFETGTSVGWSTASVGTFGNNFYVIGRRKSWI